MEKYVEIYNAFGKDKSVEEQPQYHMNCAEVLLRAANDKHELDLPEVSIRMLQGFGAGFYSEKTCGAFSGSLAALGALYTEERPSDQAKMTRAAKLLVEEFEKEFGSLDCDYIKKHHRDEVIACNPVKLRAGQVFDRVVEKLEKEYN
ncbi:MAG: C-GCAxxG-C-C family protein [Acetobacterium sp.]|nr:C-GCAxxG-C-C family protein [Bacillota bacterium]MCG2729332.1 C-GCAxxG-C-C family protein [Acetobacterium sp.]